MREGTWKKRKPPGKTPSSWDRSVVGSSGGVKRPHSDSSTSHIEKQQQKRPRNTQVQTGMYKEAVAGIKMSIIYGRHPDVKLDQTQVDLIQAKPLTAVDVNPSGETPPQLLQSTYAQGIFMITCANEFSKAWIMRAFGDLGEPWEGAKLTVVDSKDLPKRSRELFCNPDTVMTRLRIQDPELNTTDWLIMSRKISEREQTLALSIDPNSYKALTRSNDKAFWWLGRVIFRNMKVEKRNPEAESTASKAPPE
jgi:hypothetical protein